MSTFKRLRRNWIGFWGFVVVVALLGLAVFAPWLAPYDPDRMDVRFRASAPNSRHLFGTDEFGRDVLSRVIFGSRVSLLVGTISVGIGGTLGTIIGLTSGYFGGWLDNALMRLMEVIMAFPSILLALVIVSTLGPGLVNTMVAVGLVSVPRFARIVRGSVLSVKELEFVEAARAVGAADLRIICRHVLPNVTAPLTVQVTLSLASAMLTEATLSFLGLGLQPPTASWGSMLSSSRRYVELMPWASIFPGAAITLAVLGFNLFGDGIRDVLDPRMK